MSDGDIKELREFLPGQVVVRVLNALDRAGIKRIDDLRARLKDLNFGLPKLGKKSLRALRESIKRYDRANRLDGFEYILYRVMVEFVPAGRLEDFVNEIESARSRNLPYLKGDPQKLPGGPNDAEQMMIELARKFVKRIGS